MRTAGALRKTGGFSLDDDYAPYLYPYPTTRTMPGGGVGWDELHLQPAHLEEVHWAVVHLKVPHLPR